MDESFGSLMNDALNKSVDVILLDSSDDKNFDQVDNPNKDEDIMAMSTGDGDATWAVDQHASAETKSFSSHDDNEEYCDAPPWAIDEK